MRWLHHLCKVGPDDDSRLPQENVVDRPAARLLLLHEHGCSIPSEVSLFCQASHVCGNWWICCSVGQRVLFAFQKRRSAWLYRFCERLRGKGRSIVLLHNLCGRLFTIDGLKLSRGRHRIMVIRRNTPSDGTPGKRLRLRRHHSATFHTGRRGFCRRVWTFPLPIATRRLCNHSSWTLHADAGTHATRLHARTQ